MFGSPFVDNDADKADVDDNSAIKTHLMVGSISSNPESVGARH